MRNEGRKTYILIYLYTYILNILIYLYTYINEGRLIRKKGMNLLIRYMDTLSGMIMIEYLDLCTYFLGVFIWPKMLFKR
jgi:hypothetical protein